MQQRVGEKSFSGRKKNQQTIFCASLHFMHCNLQFILSRGKIRRMEERGRSLWWWIIMRMQFITEIGAVADSISPPARSHATSLNRKEITAVNHKRIYDDLTKSEASEDWRVWEFYLSRAGYLWGVNGNGKHEMVERATKSTFNKFKSNPL